MSLVTHAGSSYVAPTTCTIMDIEYTFEENNRKKHSPNLMDRFSEPTKMWHQLRLRRHGGTLHSDRRHRRMGAFHFYALVKWQHNQTLMDVDFCIKIPQAISTYRVSLQSDRILVAWLIDFIEFNSMDWCRWL